MNPRGRGIVGKKRPSTPIRIVTQCGEEQGWSPHTPAPWWKRFALAIPVIVVAAIIFALIRA